MKIIANAGNNNYLVEINTSELRELDSEAEFKIGAEFEIKKAAETLRTLRGLSRYKLDHIGEQIKLLQTKFEEVEEAYDALMLLDTVKNSEKS